MTKKNDTLEVKIGLNERGIVFVQLIDGDDTLTDTVLLGNPEYLRRHVGPSFGREIRKRKGPEASEDRGYNITMAVNPCEASLYEAFRDGVNVGIQEQPHPDRYEYQMSQALPPWYRIINKL